MEGHGVQGDAVVPAVHPVHVWEESDAAREEGEQYHAAIGFVQPTVLKSQLQGETRERKRALRRARCSSISAAGESYELLHVKPGVSVGQTMARGLYVAH